MLPLFWQAAEAGNITSDLVILFLKKCLLNSPLVQGEIYSSGVPDPNQLKRTSRAHLGRKPHPALAIILHLQLARSE